MFHRVRQFFSPRIRELAPRDAYRLWAETYPPYAHNLLMQVEERAVCELLPDVRGKRVLDLACGTGRYARILRERGARVIALDFSYEMLAQSEKTFARAQGDMNALPLNAAAIDVIVCGLAVGHVADLHRTLQEMARVLERGGTLVYSDFHAATRKWQRTFRAHNQIFAVQHFPRAESDHIRALRDAEFIIDAIRPVSITVELAHADARAETFRAQWGDTPVAIVVRAKKI